MIKGHFGYKVLKGVLLLFLQLFIHHITLSVNPNIFEYKGQLFLDTTDQLKISDVTAPSFDHNFKDAMGEDAVLKIFDHTYWYRFKILNKTDHLDLCFIPQINASNLEVYYNYKGKYFQAEVFKYINYFVFKLIIPKNYYILHHPESTQYCYLKIKAKYYTGIGYEVLSLTDLVERYIKGFLYIGFFLGLVLIVTIFNLALFFKLKEKVYFYHFTYSTSLIFYALTFWGFFDDILSNNFWLNIIYAIPYSCITISLLLYTQYFFNSKKNNPRFHNLINYTIAVKCILFVIGFSTGFYFLTNRYTDNLLLVPAIALGIINLRAGFEPAKFFLGAIAIIYLGMLITALSNILMISDSNNIFLNLAICEIVLFSIALADRLRNLKQEKQQALQQTVEMQENKNIELEQKVAERTQDLKLASLEIIRMNELLKSHSQKLETKVLETAKERITNKTLTFEEFKEIFSDDEVCLNYLSDLKWNKGYKCIKCNNTTFFLVKGSLTRRCTKCRYIESPMVNTIFDNIKFPIVKAFYILFVVSNRIDYSLENLANILELRSSTCSLFKKKIISVMQQSKGKKLSTQWNDLIYSKS